MMFHVKSEYLTDLLIQILHVISIPLLSKTTKIIKVLTDLGSRHLHKPAQILRGDPLHPVIPQFPKIPEIPRETTDHSLRNPFSFYHYATRFFSIFTLSII